MTDRPWRRLRRMGATVLGTITVLASIGAFSLGQGGSATGAGSEPPPSIADRTVSGHSGPHGTSAVTNATAAFNEGSQVVSSGTSCTVPPSVAFTTPQPNTLAVSGKCFASGERVDALLNTEAGAILLGDTTAETDGTVSTDLPLPTQFSVPLTINGQRASAVVPLRSNYTYQLDVVGTSSGDGVSSEVQFSPSIQLIATNGALSTRACSQPPANHSSNPSLPGPLHADSRWIENTSGQRVKLVSANWYGAEEADFIPGGLNCESLSTIAHEIAADGFNSVRLPWSNAMLEEDPPVCSPSTIDRPCIDPAFLVANQNLMWGGDALSIYQSVIEALARANVMVIVDDHSTDAQWQSGAENGVWWGGRLWDDYYGMPDLSGLPSNWPAREESWITDWVRMATMVSRQPNVVGADLRNEPNNIFSYGQQLSWSTNYLGFFNPDDWATAAEAAGNAVIHADRNLLVMVEGLNFSLDLSAVGGEPLYASFLNVLGIPRSHLVYSPHTYQQDPYSYAALSSAWGYILTEGQTYTAPVWVGEWGACNTPSCATDDTAGQTFETAFERYLQSTDVDWSYWAVNGTESDGGSPLPGDYRWWFDQETYGVLNPTWSAPEATPLLSNLAARGLLVCNQAPVNGCWTEKRSSSDEQGLPSAVSQR